MAVKSLRFSGAVAMVLSAAAASAQTSPLAERVTKSIEADNARLTRMYKDIHQHPELGFQEVRTAGIVARELKALGFAVKTGIGGTGVLGILKNGDGPVVMYRADMDANAVAEVNDLPYRSTVRAKRADGSETPVGHMCGHDAHVTWMLGMAKALVAAKGEWRGTAVLVAQPAEELIQGAQAMVDDGLYGRFGAPKPDYFIGMHTAPIPVGTVISSPGTMMAGTDQLDILFKGVGGHGSMPQLTKDPVVMAAFAILGYQTVVSRTIPPQETAVLTVGSVQAGSDNNVIPPTALLKANLRWFNEKTRQQLLDGIKAVSDGVARTYGVAEEQLPTITMKGHSTPLVNDEALSGRLAARLKGALGEKAVITRVPPVTGSEDVHLLRGPHADVPFAFLVVGVADPAVYAEAVKAGKQFPYAAHNSEFLVDLKAIPVGTRVATLSMLELLASR